MSARAAVYEFVKSSGSVKSPGMISMLFCLARVLILWGAEVEIISEEEGIRSWSRMCWRMREPRLPDVPVRMTFILGFGV